MLEKGLRRRYNQNWEGEKMQRLYDSNMQIVGYTATSATGRITAYDSDYQVMGYYYPASDKTYDKNMKLIGKGNQITKFLNDAASVRP